MDASVAEGQVSLLWQEAGGRCMSVSAVTRVVGFTGPVTAG